MITNVYMLTLFRCYTILLSCQVFEHTNKDPCGSCTLTELYPLLVASTLHFGASPATFDDCADRCSIDPNHELEAADVVALLNVLISTAAERAQAARLRPRVTTAKSAAPTATGASPAVLTVAPCSTAAHPPQQQQQQHVTIAAPVDVPASCGGVVAASARCSSSRASIKAQAKQQAQQQRYLERAAKKAAPTAETVTAYFEAKYDSQQQQQ
jgi:hypothetical protein